MRMLQFTWHEDKHAANIKSHKVSFLRAALIFENEILEMIDDREDYGELRYVALGRSDHRLPGCLHPARRQNRSHHQRMEGQQA
jgi:uncharacterized DUF497 family protein